LSTTGIAMRYSKRKKKPDEVPTEKICKSCKKVFKKKKRETYTQFRIRKYCSRTCTYKKHDRSYTYAEIIDACNKFIDEMRVEMGKNITVYSCKNMSQEELQKLIPATDERR